MKKKDLAILLLALATPGVISTAAFPDPVRWWSPEELHERSDLVLIGTVRKSSTPGPPRRSGWQLSPFSL